MCLVYVLLMGLGRAFGGSFADNSYQKITDAKKLIEETRTLAGNRALFDEKVSEAEAILSELRNQEKYLADVQKLQDEIEVRKKEIYDIQSIDLNKKTSVIPNIVNFSPLFTYEFNNQLLVIGRK